jgi:mRNA-degrading endonuclease toxin of MazEF toxin-antitoxin module
VNRGEVWTAQIGPKRRPVLVLTRSEVLDVRHLVTVAEVTTTRRGLAVEVELDETDLGLAQRSVINCDGLYTIPRSSLDGPRGAVDDVTMHEVCRAVGYALGC